MTSSNNIYDTALRRLSRRDSVMKKLIKEIGPCTLNTNKDYFGLLVRSIISQQISTKAAISISRKLQQTLHPKKILPKNILALDDEQLRSAGLSTAKRLSVRDLAEKIHSGQVQLKKLADRTDEEVIEHLIPVRGIGPWTAEMFLIFGLGRLDVLPVADLGLRVGVQRLYELDERPDNDKLNDIAKAWEPYRTLATWYVWCSFGAAPQTG